MTASRDWAAVGDRYMGLLAPPDLPGATHVIGDLVDDGAGVRDVVERVLSPAQDEVGRRWHANQWTVADEHAASAIAEAALVSATTYVPSAVGPGAGRVVLACATGEWHTLPLRMVSEVLTEAGFATIFLGPSVPPHHLREYIERAQPVALALHSSYALTLEGARECVDAAHEVGIPVIVGGRGFGSDAHLATVIGADHWSGSAGGAVDVLRAWAANGPPLLGVASLNLSEPLLSEPELEGARREVMLRLRADFPAVRAYSDAQWARTLEDVAYILQFAVAGVRHRDERVFSDFVTWLRDFLACRHVPGPVLAASLEAIAVAVAASRPVVAAEMRLAVSQAEPAVSLAAG